MLVDSRGAAVSLEAHLGSGAEGDVFEVSLPGLVAKVLHPPSRTPERQAKLRVMVVRVPKDPTAALGHPTLCWPRELLLDRSEVVGFLMPRLDVHAFLSLHRFMFPQFYPAHFHWGLQLEIAANLAAGLAAVHAEGYIVGDLNFRNVYVTRRCLITFLDCDSMQVTDPATGRVLRCPVGMPEYVAPELQGVALSSVDRTEASDSFAFAVMACQLLLTGTHPFTGGRGQTREQNIFGNDCFLLSGNVPRGTPSPAILPPALLDLLVRCFRDGYRSPRSRPKIHELARTLAASRGQVISCDAFPTRHVFSSHLASCPWCDQLRLSIDSYRAAAARGGTARTAAAVAAANRAAAPAGQPAAGGMAAGGQALPPAVWVCHPPGAPPLTQPRHRYGAPLLFLVVLLVALAHMVLLLIVHAAATQ
jgi:DNA-binding helix-hairpin-helix protein with protein kinase domain